MFVSGAAKKDPEYGLPGERLPAQALIAADLPFERLPAMMHSLDTQGILTRVSDSWLTGLGYRRSEVLGRPLVDFLTPASRERALKELLPAFFRTGICERAEYQMVRSDGGVMDVLLSSVLDDSKDHGGPFSVAMVTDITARRMAERRLRQSEARYRHLIEDQAELVSLAGPDGELQYVNDAYARLHGCLPEDMVGRNFLDFIPEGQKDAVARQLDDVLRSETPIEIENEVRLPNGETRWFSWTNRAVLDKDGQIAGIHSVGRDVHRRVVAELRLKQSESRFRLLAENSNDMIIQLDRNLMRTYVSPACKEMFGYEPEALLGKKSGESAHPTDSEAVKKALVDLLEGRVDRHSVTSRRRHADGRWIWVETKYRALIDPVTRTTEGLVATVRDITERKAIEVELAETNKRLEAVVGQDSLTGLDNRRRFDQRLEDAQRRALDERTPLSLVLVDVDLFKSFNDGYGHPAGDRCLRAVGQAIAASIASPRDAAARIGGEEFAILLPGVDAEGAARTAERIRRAVKDLAIRHETSPHEVVTVSVGVAEIRPGQSQAALESADKALYAAKARGRDQVARAEG